MFVIPVRDGTQYVVLAGKRIFYSQKGGQISLFSLTFILDFLYNLKLTVCVIGRVPRRTGLKYQLIGKRCKKCFRLTSPRKGSARRFTASVPAWPPRTAATYWPAEGSREEKGCPHNKYGFDLGHGKPSASFELAVSF